MMQSSRIVWKLATTRRCSRLVDFRPSSIPPRRSRLSAYSSATTNSSPSNENDNYLAFHPSSLGLEYSLVRSVLSSVRQLPEIETVWNKRKDVFATPATLVNLHRAADVFASFDKSGREHLAVQSLIAECQQRQGMYKQALVTLDQVRSMASSNLPPYFQDDVSLAIAKVHWNKGDFTSSQELCEKIITTYNDLDETFSTTNLHLASAMTGKALCQLAAMKSLQDAYSVRDYFRIAIKFLERHPPMENTVPYAAALSNAGIAEAVYNMFLEQTNHVSVPMDAALRTWFQGLQKTEMPCNKTNPQVFAASNYLEAMIRSNLAWGVLNYEQDRSDRLSKASEYAKKALFVYDDAASPVGKEGLPWVLSVIASCYHQADSAVTAEGLFQSAIDRKGLLTSTSTLLHLKHAYSQYAELCRQWEKREGDAKKLDKEVIAIDNSLPETWQGKEGISGCLWFWTPGEML